MENSTRTQMAAKQFGYDDDWKNEILICPKCGWSGTFTQGSVEQYLELMDSSCPKCDAGETPMLAIVSYPTLEETEANFDRLSEQEKDELTRKKQFIESCQNNCLRTVDQLVDLSEAQITLLWDFVGDEPGETQTVVRHGDQVVWSEPAFWEGYGRFEQVTAILKQKYGDRLVDVVPTTASELYLYGDRLNAFGIVEQARMRIRGSIKQ